MKPISQLRFNLFMLTHEEYDCSMGGNWTIDWSTRGTVRPYFGAFCIIFAVVTIPLYLLSAQVIWTMRRSATYKVMFMLAIADIATLFVNAFTFGILLIMGEVFCHHPKMHFLNALVAIFLHTFLHYVCGPRNKSHVGTHFWKNVQLSFQSKCSFFSASTNFALFHGSRTWYLLAACLFYPFFIAFFTPLFLFNSDYHLLIVNPGIYEDDRYDYYNLAHIFNNTMMLCISFTAYIFMLLYLLFKKSSSAIQDQTKTNVVNRAAMMLSIQSGIIVVVHFTTCITYMVTQYVPPSHAVLYVAQVTWQLLHGIPPFVYMLFNPSLRDGVKQYAAPVRSSFLSLPSSAAPKGTTVIPSKAPAPSHMYSIVRFTKGIPPDRSHRDCTDDGE
ncbi:hypothetical protein PRIPAC_77651, partial [Pristionchus pacificus]|uniref:G protein-coupled receptor n=1 Tax=Pristionchus pacificus TaxID=54126 RepID=A0A2A6C4L1_PRIPA